MVADNVNKVWKRLQKEAQCIKLYGSHKYVQSACGQYWYSRDTAGHGGAAFKRYRLLLFAIYSLFTYSIWICNVYLGGV